MHPSSLPYSTAPGAPLLQPLRGPSWWQVDYVEIANRVAVGRLGLANAPAQKSPRATQTQAGGAPAATPHHGGAGAAPPALALPAALAPMQGTAADGAARVPDADGAPAGVSFANGDGDEVCSGGSPVEAVHVTASGSVVSPTSLPPETLAFVEALMSPVSAPSVASSGGAVAQQGQQGLRPDPGGHGASEGSWDGGGLDPWRVEAGGSAGDDMSAPRPGAGFGVDWTRAVPGVPEGQRPSRWVPAWRVLYAPPPPLLPLFSRTPFPLSPPRSSPPLPRSTSTLTLTHLARGPPRPPPSTAVPIPFPPCAHVGEGGRCALYCAGPR